MAKAVVAFYTSARDAEEIERLARQRGMSASALLREAVHKYLLSARSEEAWGKHPAQYSEEQADA